MYYVIAALGSGVLGYAVAYIWTAELLSSKPHGAGLVVARGYHLLFSSWQFWLVTVTLFLVMAGFRYLRH